MGRKEYIATVQTGNHESVEYTLEFPDPDYTGYGSGITSKLCVIGEEGSSTTYFDERYNRELRKSMSLADFASYVQGNICTRFQDAKPDTIRVRVNIAE